MERELYEAGTLLRMHGMRRTLFVFPRDVAPLIHAGATEKIATAERKRVLDQIAGAGIAKDPTAWLAEVEASTLKALRARGEATANQLGADEPRLRTQMRFAVGKKYEGTVGVSTRLLFLLAMEGRIARGRPAGSWLSSQYRWIPIETIYPEGYPPIEPPVARTGIVRRWLEAFGPGTVADIRWYTGWTAAEVRRILDELDVVEVELDGQAGVVLADDRERDHGACPVRELPARASTRPSWAGSTGSSSWAATPRPSSTRTATPGRPSGGTGASSAGGPSGRTAGSTTSCSRTSGREAEIAIEAEGSGSGPGSGRPGSTRASARSSNGPWRVGDRPTRTPEMRRSGDATALSV